MVSETEPRSCPTRPAEWKVEPRGQLVALEQDDVAPAELGQVVGERGAADAAADDDDPGPRRQARPAAAVACLHLARLPLTRAGTP